jgi:predicted dehydrogenase
MNILIIGFGSIAEKHVKAILEVQSGASIYALRSATGAEQHKDIQNVHSLNELKIKPDFVVISNPTSLHGKTILECLDLECPLFIEKPVLNDLKDAERIIKEVRKKNTITYVACNLRFHPALQFLKQYIDTKNPHVNEVNVYCGSYLPDWRPDRDFRITYSANANMGGGVHLDVIHELDYCFWLFGIPSDVSSKKRSVSSLHIDAVDYAQFNLLYPSFTANVTLNYYRRDFKRQIEIVTSEDTLVVDLIKNRIFSNISGNVLFEQPFDLNETYLKQMEYFIDHIQKGKQPMNGFAEGVEVLKIALQE